MHPILTNCLIAFNSVLNPHLLSALRAVSLSIPQRLFCSWWHRHSTSSDLHPMLAGIGVTNWRGRSMRPSAPRGLADGITKTIIAFGVLSDQFDLVILTGVRIVRNANLAAILDVRDICFWLAQSGIQLLGSHRLRVNPLQHRKQSQASHTF